MNKSTVGYTLMIAVLLMVGFISLTHFFMTRTDSDILDMNSFPMAVGEWQGKDLEVTEQDYEILETRNLIVRDYVDPVNSQIINLFIIYSETNRSVFHPPEVCLMGGGVAIVDKKTGEINCGNNGFLANELYLEKNNDKTIALYCYSAGDLYTENFYLQQVNFAFNQMLGRHKGGATIRATMQVQDDSEKTLETLKQFMGEVVAMMKTLSVDSPQSTVHSPQIKARG